MMWRILFFIYAAKCIVQEYPTIWPKFNAVLINSSCELTCYCYSNITQTEWRTTENMHTFSYLKFSKEGTCSSNGFLADTRYFETSCFSNGTFIVTIKYVNISYDGQGWYCYERFNQSNVAKFSVVREPPSKPALTWRNRNYTVSEMIYVVRNDNVSILCSSKGEPTPNVKWLGQASGAQLHISFIQANTTRKCVASNEIKAISDENCTNLPNTTVSIVVSYPPGKPSIQFIPQNKLANSGKILKKRLIVRESSNFSITCRSDGFPPPTCTWNISNFPRSANLTFENITKNDIGRYMCNARNLVKRTFPEYEVMKNTSTALDIDVLYQSRIVEFIATGVERRTNLEATENETIALNCSIDSNPESKIKIAFRNKELGRNVSLKGLVHLHKVKSCFDDGVYSCSARNVYNTKPCLEKLALRVRCTPLLSPKLDIIANITSTQNANVTFEFKAIAYPKPTFQWYKRNGSSWNILLDCKKCKMKQYELYSSLTIIDINENDYGCYKLRIHNEVGDLEQLYFLEANDSPELINTLPSIWKYSVYSCGVLLLAVTLFVGLWFISKRRKIHTAESSGSHVSISMNETENIYQNILASRIPSTRTNRQACNFEKPAVCKRHYKSTWVQETNASGNLKEFNEKMSLEPTEYYNTLEMINNIVVIKVSEIFDYVADRTDESFSAEFQKIPTTLKLPCSIANNPKNIPHNRYRDVLPYDHTRVLLDDRPDVYINASYIDGYIRPNAYIACLGPTAKTHDNYKSFWEMVWHNKVEIVVMVTNLNESSGMKCEQYWPEVNRNEIYGDIHVSCKELQVFGEYTIRKFEISSNTITKTGCRCLTHLHYTAWPDKKTPEDVVTLLEFRQKYRDINTNLDGPVIVHCSAGIGRTGVFIAIDKLIMEGHSEGTINVLNCVKKMREQRMKMVQTSEQYKFIFKALAYALCFDSDPIPNENLKELVNGNDDTFFNRQYKQLVLPLVNKGKDILNVKAEYENVIQKDIHGEDSLGNLNRVHLYLNRSYGDADNVNAVFVNSFRCKNHFIMAQSPLPGTEIDFLTMIYQERCSCIVSMEDSMDVGHYLPTAINSINVGCFTVACSLNDSKQQYTVSKMVITNTEKISDGERDFYYFKYKTWKAEDVIPENVEEFVQFLQDVEEYVTHSNESSCVLVHCLNGSERCGIYCAIAIIMEKIFHNKKVSVLSTLRHLRTRRPAAITSMEQMKFCFQAAKAIAEMQIKTSGIH